MLLDVRIKFLPGVFACLWLTFFKLHVYPKGEKKSRFSSELSFTVLLSDSASFQGGLAKKNISLHLLRASVAVCYVLFPLLSSNLCFRANLQPLGTTLQTVLRLGFIIPELQPVTNTLAPERKLQSPFILIFCPVHWKWHIPSNYSIQMLISVMAICPLQLD